MSNRRVEIFEGMDCIVDEVVDDQGFGANLCIHYAVKRVFGDKAFFDQDLSVKSIGQIFESRGGNSAVALTGRVWTRVTEVSE